MEVFLDVRAAKDEVGIAIFQHIYHAPGTTLGAIRYNMFSRKAAAAGMIKPDQQRVQLHSILSEHIFKPGTGCSYKACLWTPVNMGGRSFSHQRVVFGAKKYSGL